MHRVPTDRPIRTDMVYHVRTGELTPITYRTPENRTPEIRNFETMLMFRRFKMQKVCFAESNRLQGLITADLEELL